MRTTREYQDDFEFFNALKAHGPFIYERLTNSYYRPVSIVTLNENERSIIIIGRDNKNRQLSYFDLYRFYVWQDGMPCHVEK